MHVDASAATGGSVVFVRRLLGSLDSSIDVTVIGHVGVVVDTAAADRQGAATVVLPAVANKLHLWSIARLAWAVRRARPDVLHVNLDNAFTGQYGLLAGYLTRTPTLAVVHSDSPAWNKLQLGLSRRMARHVDAYVSISTDTARAVEGMLGLASGSVRVIHGGAEPPSAVPDAAERPSGFVVGAVGRLAEEKGLRVLLRAIAIIPAVHLVLVGEGELREDLEAMCTELGISDRVTFAGWVASWTSRWSFDVLAVPSLQEAMGLVIPEAMMAGIPVVATRVGGIPEIVADGETGVLVDPDDDAALAGALQDLLDHPERRRQLAGRAKAFALEQLTVSGMARSYGALYRQLARRRRRPGRRSVAG